MYQIDDITAVTPVPAPPTDNIGTPGFFTGGDPANSVPATRVRYWWLNCIQQALIGLLVGAGVAQSKTDFTVVPQAVAIIGRRHAVFGTSGSFTVPAGVFRLKVRMWAAGGSGGTTTNIAYPGGGGGSGGYVEAYMAVTPGQVIPYTVGQGVAAGNGGNSTFLTLTAGGGQAGSPGTSSTIGNGGNAGGATGGAVNLPGYPGSTGLSYGTTGAVEGGRGAGAPMGGSVAFATGSSTVGFNANPGTFPGGGSTGCTNSTAPGGNGLIIVEY